MAYIPDEHKQYPVLPYSRENGGEVFQYLSWPEQKLRDLIGDELIPYGYGSYEEYFDKIDSYIREYADNPDAVKLLNKCKKNITLWNRKEEWSICKYLGKTDPQDLGLGLHHGGYYYWPCIAENPRYDGVIDDEEFTAYLYPTDSSLWEIIVDPTGMAQRTMNGGENTMTANEYSHVMEQLKNMKEEDLSDVRTIGSVPRLNELKKVEVRYLGDDEQNFVQDKAYAAYVLEDGSLLVGGENRQAKVYDADLFEIVQNEIVQEINVVFGSYYEYEEDEILACVKTEEDEISLNISLDQESDWGLKEGERCSAHLWTNDSDVRIYGTETEYQEADTGMPPVSICPLGTLQANPDEEDLKQNAFILFSGIIREAERNPAPKEGKPIWRLGIETYPFYFDLLYYKDEPVAPGNLVHGRAWLRGTMKRAEME